jgi:glycosyltransferase involved in cell wall biosynthesis
VTLVLKAPVRTDRLIAPLQAEAGVTVLSTHDEHLLPDLDGTALSPAQAIRVMRDLDTKHACDLLVVRGRKLASQVAADGAFDGRLWTYLTDFPQSVPEMTPGAAADLAKIASASRYLLCQTEEIRCFLEGSVAEACGKCVLLPPIVPPAPSAPPALSHRSTGGPLRLVYTGKFAPRWNTYEMTQLPDLLAARGVRAELHMVGDKIHNDRADPGYRERMLDALGGTPGLIWHGGRGREDAMRIAASCDIGLGWRHPSLDASLELSTKLLEYGTLGVPVILNRTPMHEALLGVDYPLFARDLGDVADTAAAAVADPLLYRLATDRVRGAAEQFTLDRAAERLRRYLSRACPALATIEPGLHVVVAGHDLKFFTPLLEYLRRQPELEVRVDHWAALGEHDASASTELAQWADVVICEWCGPNAVWYSRHKRRGSRLLVRLHRFELYSHYPAQVRIRAVDQVVCVSRHYARLCRERAGWPADKVVTVPNALDIDQLDRPKLDGARFNLGIVGIVPSRKRLDLALDVLEELRRDDDRYLLYVKSGMPWEHWWVWQKAEQREHYESVLRRIQRSPLLQGAVVFDDAGPDVAAWLRRVGFVLSTSDDESFHVAPAEGMASRAVPVIRHWPGAETIYDMRWVHRSPAEMAAAIVGTGGEDGWRQAGEAAHAQAAAAFELGKVCGAWRGLLTEDLAPAVPDPIFELLGSP